MTIGEAIYRFDAAEENGMEKGEKINLLSRLDGRIFNAILRAVEGAKDSFEGYEEDADLTDELLVPFPYDDIYVLYLTAMNALACGNIQRYTVYAALYNSRYEELAGMCIREKKNGAVRKIKLEGE